MRAVSHGDERLVRVSLHALGFMLSDRLCRERFLLLRVGDLHTGSRALLVEEPALAEVVLAVVREEVLFPVVRAVARRWAEQLEAVERAEEREVDHSLEARN